MVDQSCDDNTQSYLAFSMGMMVPHYRIVEKIGSGGMGDVYLVDDTKLKRKAALEFLPVQLGADRDLVARFNREAQAAAALSHPNIIHVYDV
jgi:serine/threonine-protein kinase